MATITKTPRVRPTHLVGLLAGAVVFWLVVWLAFAIGTWRMRPDLGLDAAVELASAPQIEFDPEPQGWELVSPADETTGQGPQYASHAAANEAVCVLSWQTGSVTRDVVDLSGFETDAEATQAMLEAASMDVDHIDQVQLRTTEGETLELVSTQEPPKDGLASASAARAFATSNHYLILTLVCDGTSGVTAELMHQALEDATVRLDIRS